MSGLIEQCIQFSDPVQVRAEIESYGLRHRSGRDYDIVSCEVSFWMGERRLSELEYPYETAKLLVEGPVLDEPVILGLIAQTSPGRSRGKLRIVVTGVPTTEVQEAQILDADRTLTSTLALWFLPDDHVGLRFGDRWFPAGEDVLAPVEHGPDLVARLDEFGDRLQPFFDRILYGNPAQEVDRLIRSLPTLESEC